MEDIGAAPYVKKGKGQSLTAAELSNLFDIMSRYSDADERVSAAVQHKYNGATAKKYASDLDGLKRKIQDMEVVELREAAFIEVSRLLRYSHIEVIRFVNSHYPSKIFGRRFQETFSRQRLGYVCERKAYQLARQPFAPIGMTTRELGKAASRTGIKFVAHEPDGSVVLHAIPVLWAKSKSLGKVGRPQTPLVYRSWLLLVGQRKVPIPTVLVDVIQDRESISGRIAIFREILEKIGNYFCIKLVTDDGDDGPIASALPGMPLEKIRDEFGKHVEFDLPTHGKGEIKIPGLFKSREELTKKIRRLFDRKIKIQGRSIRFEDWDVGAPE